MAAAQRGRFVIRDDHSGRKYETSYFGFLGYAIFKFYGKNMFSDHDFILKCTLKDIAHQLFMR